jgi:hypothetical protein
MEIHSSASFLLAAPEVTAIEATSNFWALRQRK